MGEVAEQLIAGGDKPTDITVQKDKNHVYPVYANGVIDGGIQGYSSKARVNKPAVTIAARGTIGFCCIRDAGFTPVVRLISMVPDSSLDLTYLKYYIDSLNLAGSGTSQAQLTVPDFRMKPILIPKISDQHKFAALVAQVDKSRFAGVKVASASTKNYADNIIVHNKCGCIPGKALYGAKEVTEYTLLKLQELYDSLTRKYFAL